MEKAMERPNIFTYEQEEAIVELLETLNDDTQLYFGCDSVAFRKSGKWYARFATVLIVHMNGNKGCKIFRNISDEQVYDTMKGKPADRLMKEVYKIVDLYLQLSPLLDGYDMHIHLDINPNPKHGSSCVATQAAGYVLGMTGIEPVMKPQTPDDPIAWASSFGADGVGRGFDKRAVSYSKNVH